MATFTSHNQAQKGRISFSTFPDTGSAATLVASNIAKRENINTSGKSQARYISVNGDEVATEGVAPITLTTRNNITTATDAVISPAIKIEIIVGREDLKRLKIVPNHFPEPITSMHKDKNKLD